MIKNLDYDLRLLFLLFLSHTEERDVSYLKLAFCITVQYKVSVPHKGVKMPAPKISKATARKKEKPEVKPLSAKAVSKA